MNATREDRDKSATPPPAPDGSPATPPQPPRFSLSRRWILFGLALLAFNFYLGSRAMQPQSRIRVPYSPFFLKQVSAGHVKEITSKGTAVQGTFTQKERYAGSKPTTRFRTEVPAFADNDALSRLLQQKGVVVNAEPLDTGAPWWQNLLLGFGPTILFLFLLFWLMRRAGNVQNILGSFGRSSARRYQPSGDRVTFADVAGIDEAKAELTEVVDFLRHPEKYQKLGGRIPHGVLLSGPPGTGKTLLARAVAGEADVPFFSMAASEFVEAIVGVGASRVRDLFMQAKEAAPAIVFIDELDAIGRSRSAGIGGFGGGHDEREQTLNQILTEMDGFDSSTSVIVIGATNRPDVLDQALLRPGRFDRRVAVQPPDRAGREAILRVHTRALPLGPDVDLGRIAATTPGMVGADLANLANEAALLAARRNHEVVDESDFTDALERIVLGAERQVLMSPEDRRRTAYHEAGHAIVAGGMPKSFLVQKVTIVPRGQAGGYTLYLPEEDSLRYTTVSQFEARLVSALGGRLAEEIVFGPSEVTTGASSDITYVTRIARAMVTRYGMSEKLGPIAFGEKEELIFLGREISEQRNYGDEVAREIDREVHRIVAEAYERTREILTTNRDVLNDMASSLLENETVDGERLRELMARVKPMKETETLANGNGSNEPPIVIAPPM